MNRTIWRKLLVAGVLGVGCIAWPPAARRIAAGDAIRVAKVVRARTQPASRPGDEGPASRPADEADTLEQCRELYMAGSYEPAAKGYRKLIAEQDAPVPAAIGLARALAIQGRYADARKALKAAAAAGETHAPWHVAAAELLMTVGEYADALRHAEAAEQHRPHWAPAILVHGRLLETLGRREEATRVYLSMQEVIDRGGFLNDARSLVALGLIMERHAILTGRTASLVADNIYNNYLRQVYLEVDEGYWPAYVAAGEFALGKHRFRTAAHEFGLALKRNQHIPAAHVGLGAVALHGWKFEQALKRADAALKINPRHAGALLLKAACYMQWRKFDRVGPLLEKALEVNPRHLEALSMMAALHVRTFQPDEARPFIRRVEAVCPNSAQVHETIATWLSAGRQFDLAEKHYRTAIERAEHLAGPLAGLGCLYMQTGEEDKARQALRKAHEIDDFRADVVNYLTVLGKLAHFRVKETEHFVVKVDGRRDAVLLDQVSEYLEEIYDEVCADYACRPQAKTIVEIFPTQVQFSERIAGRGWIPTVGASTGRVIALAAPTPETHRTPFGTHNWAVVLRHEFTHTVTLAATRNRIPHWFTEACAVWQQPDKWSYKNVAVLVKAVVGGRLFAVEDLDWGFIRPRRRGDRHLAYQQSQWMLDYIIRTRGYDTVVRMLESFRDGMTQAEVFEKVVGQKQKAFDKAFAAWAKQQVADWGFRSEPPPDLAKAVQRAKDEPDDPNAQSDLAVAHYTRGRRGPAEQTARKTLELDADNVSALAVLARVLAAKKKYAEAIETAEKLEAAKPDSVTAPHVLAECYLARKGRGSLARAIQALKRLQQRQRYHRYSYEQLAKLYTRLGMLEEALPNLVHLHRHTMKDPGYARQAAEIYRSLGKDDLALKYYQEVLYINPYDATVYEAVAALHRLAGRYPKAIAAVRKLTLLEPDSAPAWNKLAMIQFRAWKAGGRRNRDLLLDARQAVQKAIDLDAGGPGERILEAIEKALKASPAAA
jgi:tetratricopeptide (TPR) repeat protein